MAVSCLVIETLQSFKEGEATTDRISKKMFKNFFDENQEYFPGFAALAHEFYKDIRCGILHQSETTNAWRIIITGKLLDLPGFSINAALFVKSLEKTIDRYLDQFATSAFESAIWTNAYIKLNNICANCNRLQQ